MADLRVVTLLPTQNVQGVQQPQVTGNQSAPGALANFAVGSILSGFIINRNVTGNPILRTDSGDVAFQSNFFLKIGSEVTIRIENAAGHVTARLLTVNGQPPEIAAQQSGFSQEPEVIVSQNLSNNPPPQNNAAPTTQTVATAPATPSRVAVTGILLTPALLETGEPALPPGAQISFRIAAFSPPPSPLTTPNPATPSPAPAPGYASYARPAATAATSSPPAAAPTPSPATPVSPSPTVAVTPTANVAEPVSQLPVITQVPQVGQRVEAVVIGSEPMGEMLVQTPIGTVRLQPGVQLPVNSKITFELTQISAPETQSLAASAIVSAPLTPITQLARVWPAMQSIFSLLMNNPSPEAQSFVTDTLPTPNPAEAATSRTTPDIHNLPAAILHFAGALKSNDLRQWLGEANASWLEQNGHGDLLKKAEGEFTSLSRQFTEAQPHQWQSMFFPVAVEGVLQQLRLFVKRDRRQREENGRQKPEEDTRFVLEMELSQLGELQMDGFVRRRDEAMQFDLIIRSHTALSQDVQNDIAQIYNSAGELTGYKGNIAFQAVRDFPVKPMDDIVSEHVKGVVA